MNKELTLPNVQGTEGKRAMLTMTELKPRVDVKPDGSYLEYHLIPKS